MHRHYIKTEIPASNILSSCYVLSSHVTHGKTEAAESAVCGHVPRPLEKYRLQTPSPLSSRGL